MIRRAALRPQPCKEFLNARCVRADVASADSRLRAHVDAAARARRRDAHHHVVLEAEPARSRHRFDAAGVLIGGAHLEAHRVHRGERARERLRGRRRKLQRPQAGIAQLLQLGEMALVRFGLRELRRLSRIGGDVVDVGQRLHAAQVLERHRGARRAKQQRRDQRALRRAQAGNRQRDAGGADRRHPGEHGAGEHAEADAERPQAGAHAETGEDQERGGENRERERDAGPPHRGEATTPAPRAPAGCPRARGAGAASCAASRCAR
jgi:hypothetical protein